MVAAKLKYTRAIQLAMSMHPRVFTMEPWYIEATCYVKEYQQKQQQQEQQAWHEARKEYMNLLEKELKALDQASEKGLKPFLKYIYSTHAPKKTHQTPNLEAEDISLRKTIVTSLALYHPDKQDVETHGMKWKVLSEEIYKRLSSHFQDFKGQN